ncbi:hypothetical protein [Actinoplanes sp. NPDC051411]|uniref:hypothetical protein n=1 Tax=Actinoplanes sp. NPDC051411 TaxID=3155522 RepID=UPI0034288829
MRAVNEVVEEQPAETPPSPAVPVEPGRRARDLWPLVSYAALSVFVMFRLWLDPNGRVLSGNKDDHGFFLFVMAHGERVLFHGANPFSDDRLNAPGVVNMMANTSVLGLSIPMAPVTHFFGPGVSVVFLLTLGLAGTAAAWYWVLSRHFVRSRVAAWIGGLWCGFAPAMISHSNAHVNFVNAWLVPFIVLQVVRLREPGRVWRGGITIGLLVVGQVFLNEEVLLFTALALGAFVVAYALSVPRRAMREARQFLAGLGVAVLVALVLLAYPLWWQFTQGGSYRGQPFAPDQYVTDLASLGTFGRQSVAGNVTLARALSVSATEDDTFFGPFGLVMIIVSMVVLWRSLAARATAIAGIAVLVCSLGTKLRVGSVVTPIPLPFGLLRHLPLIDLVSVVRFGMVAAVIAGVLLALATDRLTSFSARGRRLFVAGLVLALVPLTPKPLATFDAAPLPAFLADGTWRQYVTGDHTLVTVPLPEVTTGREGMRWAALTGLRIPMPRGYFMGPANPPGDLTGSWTAPPRPTSTMLRDIVFTGRAPVVDDQVRSEFRADLAYWRAAVVVLVPGAVHEDVLRSTVTQALGPPRLVGGVEIWDVRSLS